MTTGIDLICEDLQKRPKAFIWHGALEPERLYEWATDRGLDIPSDLIELWATLGGGEMFETEQVLVPYDGPEYAADFDASNAAHSAAGLPKGVFVFHEGCWLSAVRDVELRYVILDPETYEVLDAFSSLDQWYRRTVRKEFWARYGLDPK